MIRKFYLEKNIDPKVVPSLWIRINDDNQLNWSESLFTIKETTNEQGRVACIGLVKLYENMIQNAYDTRSLFSQQIFALSCSHVCKIVDSYMYEWLY